MTEAPADIKKKFSYILANNPAVIYTSRVGGDWGANFISENVREQLGYDPKDFTENSNFWVSLIHPDDRERVLANLQHILETDFHAHEYRFRRKDGTYIWLHDESRLIRDENGKPLECVGFMSDITERKKAGAELSRYKERLEELVKERTDDLERANQDLLKREKELNHEKIIAQEARGRITTYFDFMTHDITNMITPIAVYAEIIKNESGIPKDAREYSQKISRHMQRLSTFLSRIRILAEAENILPWDSEPANLQDAIKKCEEILNKRYPEKQIELKYSVPLGKTIESVGGRYLLEVVLEILDNAVKHSKDDLVNIEFDIIPTIATNNEPTWKISIADDGPGTSSTVKQNLTRPFDLSKRDKRIVASGLLFVSTIIEHFGGRIWIEDHVIDGRVKGSICFIEIPQFTSRRPRKKRGS